MVQSLTISISAKEFESLIDTAVDKAISKQNRSVESDVLLTTEQAQKYLSCSGAFLWKLRRENKIQAVNAGKKILIPKSSIDNYLQLKKGGDQ
jgi:excisionase family DNA binding protein